MVACEGSHFFCFTYPLAFKLEGENKPSPAVGKSVPVKELAKRTLKQLNI